jgi:hypothetical protein
MWATRASIVEEEVRAGRMTPEQAANHPSKNVISRALGAEETVEVDLKTMEVEEGTSFLLCSDGITRHIPDPELRLVLLSQGALPDLCEELKQKCLERGAEDNLTAVLVRVGPPSDALRDLSVGERTLQMDYPPAETAAPVAAASFAGDLHKTEDPLTPASRVAFPASTSAEAVAATTEQKPINIPPTPPKGGGLGRSIARFFVFLLVVGAVAGAFFYGTRYRGHLPFGLTKPADPAPAPSPVPTAEDPVMAFEKSRRIVDQAPADWILKTMPKETARQNIAKPLDSTDPQFLYLYGRALLLNGEYEAAAETFAQTIARADQVPNIENATIRREAVLGLAAASLKSNKDAQRAVTHLDELAPKPTASQSP